MLARCVRQALLQTRPPSEIVIVDASADFDGNREATEAVVRSLAPELRFVYERARRPQQTVQRNQAVALASADVLFLIDDDSLMYPECAARIMAVYERPGCEQVVAVMTELHGSPPDAVQAPSEPSEPPSRWLGLASRLSHKLKGDFFPSDDGAPGFPTPELGPGERRAGDLHGARITARRSAVLASPFDEALLFNAHEDRDAAFRLRRLGVIVHIGEPLVCHAEAVRSDNTARRGFAYRGAWLLNYAYLMQKWCADRPAYARKRVARFAGSMLLLDGLSALRTKSAGRVRGVHYVRRELLPRLLAAPPAELSSTMLALSSELRARADSIRG